MNPVLFILMRTDLESMNSGKAMAQAAHAANALGNHFDQLVRQAFDVDGPDEETQTIINAWTDWKWQTPQGFGTTIVLGATMAKIKTDVEWLKSEYTPAVSLCDIVHDPTYPLVDGSVTHLIPLDTCAYIFAPDKDDIYLRHVLDSYELHP